jgi:predicted ribosomally synthesized peptide with SipW-like signal peptide
MSRPTRRPRRGALAPFAVAVTALAAGVALIGGAPGTFAFLSDTTTQPTKTVTSGGLELTIAQSSQWVSTTGTGAGAGSIVAVGTTGYVPGQRGQKLTFTLTNAATSATPATLSSALTSGAFWADLSAKQLLTVTPSVVSGPCSVGSLSATATGISIPVTSTALRPGASCTVSFTVGIPTGSATVDAASYLRSAMKTTVAPFTMAGTLTQAAR